jgi:hypothetical protein
LACLRWKKRLPKHREIEEWWTFKTNSTNYRNTTQHITISIKQSYILYW